MGSRLMAQQKQYASDLKSLLKQDSQPFKKKDIMHFVQTVDKICNWGEQDRNGITDLETWDKIGKALQSDSRASVSDKMVWSNIRMCLARLTPQNILLSQASATKIFKMGDQTPATTTADQSQVTTTQPQLLHPRDLASVATVAKGPLEQIDTESSPLHGQNVPLGPEQTPHLNSPPGPGEKTGEIEQKMVTEDALQTTPSGHQPAIEDPDDAWLRNTAWELKLAATFVVSIPCSEFPLYSVPVSSPPPSAVLLPANAALSKDIHVTPALHIWVQNTQQLKAEETIQSQTAPTSQIMAVVSVPDSHPTLTLQKGGKSVSGLIDARAHVSVILERDASLSCLPQLQIPSTLSLKGLFLPNFNPGKATHPYLLWKPPEDDDGRGGRGTEETWDVEWFHSAC